MQKSILIVDDIPENIDILVAVLSDDYKTYAATNGKLALDLVGKNKPDLILLDIMMPQMSGFEVCEKLKADPETQHIPIIFITAKTAAEDVIKGLKMGAADYITKPFNPYELLERIKNVGALHDHNSELDAFLREKDNELDTVKTQLQTLENVFGIQPYIQNLDFTLPSNIKYVQPMLDFLNRCYTEFCTLNELDHMSLNIALNEAILNSLIHGNFQISSQIKQEDWSKFDELVQLRGKDPNFNQKQIKLSYRATEDFLEFSIEDEGKGFDVSKLNEFNETDMLLESGRGILLIRSFMDEVHWNEKGNRITMIKKAVTPLPS
jgi:DNA-binding response OmpR family regulator/anti-sigma regulatory factor (Ser/Thr protein kinase)